MKSFRLFVKAVCPDEYLNAGFMSFMSTEIKAETLPITLGRSVVCLTWLDSTVLRMEAEETQKN